MRHPIFRTFLLAITLLCGLLLLHFLPDWSVGTWQAKPVDPLSDIRHADSLSADTAQPFIPISADSCKPGVTCIADFASDTLPNMSRFYEALDAVSSRPVRIGFVGDSFIEMDILTDALRDLLQQHYGGSGVGFVTINHIALAGRPTVHETCSCYDMHSAVDKVKDASLPDLSGYYFLPQTGARVTLSGNSEYSPRLGQAQVSHFILQTRGTPATLTARADKGQVRSFTTNPTGLQVLTFSAPMQQVSWTLQTPANAVVYGLTMEAEQGIVLDNLSLRGSTGLTIPAIPVERLAQLDAERHYDLIVMQYGLNVMRRGTRDYSKYTQQMTHVIDHLRRAMPHTAILIVGMGDRCGKLSTGQIGTLPEVVPLIEAQANAAMLTQVAFWNMFEAMGGEGTMATYANANPPLAARDYTHINEEGGKRIARHLFDAIVWGHELYNLTHTP